jgi:hypothetical protein
LLRRTRERGELHDTGAPVFELAILEWRAGNRDTAEDHRTTAGDLVRDQHDFDTWLMRASLVRGTAARARSRSRGCRTSGASCRADRQSADRGAGDHSARSVELWTGQPTAAHELLNPVRESFLASDRGFLGSMTLGLWSYDIEALIATGRLEGAQLALEDLLHRASYSEKPSPVKRQLDRELLQNASESRSFSARRSSSSTCSIDAGRPGFADANAASAASLTNARNRITTDVDAPLAGSIRLRELLRGDLEEHLPLLLRRELPGPAPHTVLHRSDLLGLGPHSLPR